MALEDMRTGLDLFNYVMTFGGQEGGMNDDYAATVKACLRKEYAEFLQMHKWWFGLARRPAVLAIQPLQTVTAVTISGATVTLSSVIATSQADNKFCLQADGIPYRVISHTAGTNTLTLDTTYVEAQRSGAAWIYQDEYLAPSDCMKPWGPLRSRSNYQHIVDLLPDKQYDELYGSWRLFGPRPVAAGKIGAGYQDPLTGQMQHVLTFAPLSDQALTLEFQYTKRVTLDFSGSLATDAPVLPEEDRWVLAEKALWTLWRNKNDDLADSAELKAQKKIETMLSHHLPIETRAGFYARANHNLGAR